MSEEIENKINSNGVSGKVEILGRVPAQFLTELNSLVSSLNEPKDNGNGINDNIDFNVEVRFFEIQLIKYALKRADGNQLKAAQSLNLKHSTLNAKIKQYGIKWER